MVAMASSEITCPITPKKSSRLGDAKHIVTTESVGTSVLPNSSFCRPPFVELTKEDRAAIGVEVPLTRSSVQPAPNTFPMARIACADSDSNTCRSKAIARTSGIAFLAIARRAASSALRDTARCERMSDLSNQHDALSRASSGTHTTLPIVPRRCGR